jgi:hypothetical protein
MNITFSECAAPLPELKINFMQNIDRYSCGVLAIKKRFNDHLHGFCSSNGTF